MNSKMLIMVVAATMAVPPSQAERPPRELFCAEDRVEDVDKVLALFQDMRATLDVCLSDEEAAPGSCRTAFSDLKFVATIPANGGRSQFQCLDRYMSSLRPYDIASSSSHVRLLNESVWYSQRALAFLETKSYREITRKKRHRP